MTDPDSKSPLTDTEQEAVDVARMSGGGSCDIRVIPRTRQTVPVQVAAVTSWWKNIEHINQPCLEVQLAAIQSNSSSIRLIHNPHVDAQIKAVVEYPRHLEDIRNPSEEVYLAALNADRSDLGDVKIPLSKMPPSVVLAIVSKSGRRIEDIKNPTEELLLAAARQDGFAVSRIQNISPAVKRAAVLSDPMCLFGFKEPPSHRLALLAATLDSRVIKGLSDPLPSVRLAALARFGVKTLERLPKSATLTAPAVIRALTQNNSFKSRHDNQASHHILMDAYSALDRLMSDWHPRQVLRLAHTRPDLFEAGACCERLRAALENTAERSAARKKPAARPLMRL